RAPVEFVGLPQGISTHATPQYSPLTNDALPSSHCSSDVFVPSPHTAQPEIGVPVHSLATHASFSVHASLSLHGSAFAVPEQPVGRQMSFVHGFKSLHSELFATWLHSPFTGLHESAVHGTESSQVVAGCWHVPPFSAVLQMSVVQLLLSEHSGTAG